MISRNFSSRTPYIDITDWNEDVIGLSAKDRIVCVHVSDKIFEIFIRLYKVQILVMPTMLVFKDQI